MALAFIFVPAGKITEHHLDLLEEASKDAPDFHKPSREELRQAHQTGEKMLFELVEEGAGAAAPPPLGVALFAILGEGPAGRGEAPAPSASRRLFIEAFTHHGAGWKWKWILGVFRAMAHHWNCDKIETTVYDKRFAQALLKIGSLAGRPKINVEAQVITFDLETEHE